MSRAPVYIRRNVDDDLPVRRDSREDEEEEDEERTGLRRNSLCLLLALLVALALLSIILLCMNLMLIRSLEMGSRGMRLIHFYSSRNEETGEEEKMVSFHGDVDLGKVVATSGRVQGKEGRELEVAGSRVVVEGSPNGTRLALQPTGCRLDQLSDFQVVSSKNNRPVFSALHPILPLSKSIKKISSSSIVTNKIRSPVNERLRVNVEDISVRGSQELRLSGRGVHFASGTGIHLNTSRDGSLHVGGVVYLGGAHSSVPLSPSPSLAASIDGFRLCICSRPRGRLFAVGPTKPCLAPPDICTA